MKNKSYNSTNRKGKSRGGYAKTLEEKYDKFCVWYKQEIKKTGVIKKKSRLVLYYLDEMPTFTEFTYLLKEAGGSLADVRNYLKHSTDLETARQLNYEMSKFTKDKNLLIDRYGETTTEWLNRIKDTSEGQQFITQLSSDYQTLKSSFGADEAKHMISSYYFGS